MSRLEIWRHAFPVAGKSAALAERVEALGFDGLLFADSQNLEGDVYVELALAARATERLRLGVGVTNPLTRHPAVTASAIATVQVESGGRAVLGVGRGDSALRQIGHEPAPVERFERYVERVQTYLRGEAVDMEGTASRIAWLAAAGQPKVPVDVAATGPHVIAAGARLAERVTFTVGADRDRLAWAVDSARAAATAGSAPSLGAYVNVGCGDDVRAACALVRGSAGILAHFSSMGHDQPERVATEDRAVIEALGRSYDEARHGQTAAPHSAILDDAFLERFAVVGPPERCAERLRALADVGLDRIVMVPGSIDADPEAVALSDERFAREAIPLLRTGR